MRIVSIGEVLWDVIGDKEYLGGAALNFAAHAARLGHTVFFVSAIGPSPLTRITVAPVFTTAGITYTVIPVV